MKKLFSKIIAVYKNEGPRRFFLRSFDFVFSRFIALLYKIKIIRSNPISRKLLKFYLATLEQLYPKSTDASTIKFLEISPDDVELYFDDFPQKFGVVKGGDWDLNSKEFEETLVYKSLEKHFEYENEWEQTELFKKYKQRFKSGDFRREYDSVKDFLKEIDCLLQEIRVEGYKSQKELLEEAPAETWKENNDTIHPILNEVGVNIGRNGQIGKICSGKHRLAIAKLLEIDEILVVVRARHEKWEEIRKRIEEATSFDDLPPELKQFKDHPDLQEIMPE